MTDEETETPRYRRPPSPNADEPGAESNSPDIDQATPSSRPRIAQRPARDGFVPVLGSTIHLSTGLKPKSLPPRWTDTSEVPNTDGIEGHSISSALPALPPSRSASSVRFLPPLPSENIQAIQEMILKSNTGTPATQHISSSPDKISDERKQRWDKEWGEYYPVNSKVSILSPGQKQPWQKEDEGNEQDHSSARTKLGKHGTEMNTERLANNVPSRKPPWVDDLEASPEKDERSNDAINNRGEPGMDSRSFAVEEEKTKSTAHQSHEKDSAWFGLKVELKQPSFSQVRTKRSEIQAQKLDLIPLHVSAFEYALYPFLRAHPPHVPLIEPSLPTDSDDLIGFPSLRTPPDTDESSVVTEEVRLPLQADGLAPILEGKDRLETRIKVLRVRTALMRCSVIARSIWELEHNAWKSGSSVYREYSRMSKIAQLALSLARELRSDALQARCYYWIGRACGGQRYWDEAKTSFDRAIRLNPQDEAEGGLTHTEKADVDFLLANVEKRVERDEGERRQRWIRDEERAWKISDETGRPFEEVLLQVLTRSPPWQPDMDWIEQQRKESQDKAEGGEAATDSAVPHHWVPGGLTVEEIHYINHGNRKRKPTRGRRHQQENAHVQNRRFNTDRQESVMRRSDVPSPIDTGTKHDRAAADDGYESNVDVTRKLADEETPKADAFKASARTGKYAVRPAVLDYQGLEQHASDTWGDNEVVEIINTSPTPQNGIPCPNPSQHDASWLKLSSATTIAQFSPGLPRTSSPTEHFSTPMSMERPLTPELAHTSSPTSSYNPVASPPDRHIDHT